MNLREISPRGAGIMIDAIHVILGLLTVVMAFFAISDTDRYRRFFPLIFLCAALINLATAFYEFRMYPRVRKKTISAWCYTAGGVLILLLAMVSAASLWK